MEDKPTLARFIALWWIVETRAFYLLYLPTYIAFPYVELRFGLHGGKQVLLVSPRR